MFYCSWKERGEKRKSYRAAANYQSCRALLPRHRSVPTAAEWETELKGCSELPPEPSALTLSQSSPAPHQTRSLFLAGQIGEERREALLSPRPGHTWPAPAASAGTGTRLHLAGVSRESRGEQGRAGESRGEQLLGASIHSSLCSREPELNVEQWGQVSDHSKVPLRFAFRRTVCSAEPVLGKAPSVIRINLTQLSGELSDS